MTKNVDILNLERLQSVRDLHIVLPVLVYLEKKHELNVKTCNIFNGYYYILKYRPKMVLVSNFGGSWINHSIIKFAHALGIKTVSLIAEGNVKETALETFVWGNNKDQKLYVDKYLLWSNRSLQLFAKGYPQITDALSVSGGTGFDRYSLIKPTEQNPFPKTDQYKHIIGIAAWCFDHFLEEEEYYQQHKEFYIGAFGEKQIQMHRDDLEKIQDIYREIISNNPDTLFILRYHPGTLNFERHEFAKSIDLPNVVTSNPQKHDAYSIETVIRACDLWLAYESTTALEAWLLGKQTFLINPTTAEFIRENIYKGSPAVKDAKEAQQLIDEYKATSSMNRFVECDRHRGELIADSIGFADGKNHQRAADEIIKVLESPKKKANLKLLPFMQAVKATIKYLIKRQERSPERYLSMRKQYQEAIQDPQS